MSSILSMDRDLMVGNIVRVTKAAKAFGVPIVVSTVNVTTGRNKPMFSQLHDVLPGIEPIDRTTINAWEDADFLGAVRATGRRKLIMAALWTEACVAFPTLDALQEGFEVYPVVDAVGGTSAEAHKSGLERITKRCGS